MEEKITKQTLIEMNQLLIDDNNRIINDYELQITKIQHEIDVLKHYNKECQKRINDINKII